MNKEKGKEEESEARGILIPGIILVVNLQESHLYFTFIVRCQSHGNNNIS